MDVGSYLSCFASDPAPACALGEQQKMAQVLELLPPTWKIWMKLLASGFSQPSYGHCGHLESEPVDEGSLSRFLSLY